MNRLRRIVLVLAVATALCSAQSVAQGATSTPFAEQAAKAGYTGAQTAVLQAQVDDVVTETGGRQVALNQVAWKGGVTTLVLPGETRARRLDQSPAQVEAWPYGCSYLYFCTYANRDYSGAQTFLYNCASTAVLPFRSYVNNQTRGTIAHWGGHVIGQSKPAPSGYPFDTITDYITVKPC
jgi:hypothetical protein